MKSTRNTLNKVRKSISRYGMIETGDSVVVAVSGGPDSVCLLDILHRLSEELRVSLIVAHYNHGLRPAEDQTETEFVRSLSASMQLPFETEKAALLSAKSAASTEEMAREARYQFLEGVKDRYGARRIAVGHHLNDQAETVLMRLLRGSGPSGLAGIPPCRDHTIIRPLIEIGREEIDAYLKERKLSSVIDSSNLQSRYVRNRIRLELMPLLLQYQPRLIEHLGEMASLLREENEYMETLAEAWIKSEAAEGPEKDITIPLSSFLDLPQALRNRVTRRLFSRIRGSIRRISRTHIHSVYRLATSGNPQGMLNLPDRLRVKKVYDRLSFTLREKEKGRDFCYTLEGPGTFFLAEIGRSLTLAEREQAVGFNTSHSPWMAHLDADKIHYPLVVRNFRAGDRFVPLGMKGHKKLKDFFVDLKVPTDLRRQTPLLCSEDTLVWVCGYRIDDRFKVTPSTRTVLEARLY